MAHTGEAQREVNNGQTMENWANNDRTATTQRPQANLAAESKTNSSAWTAADPVRFSTVADVDRSETLNETPSTLTGNSAATFASVRPVVSAQSNVSDYETSGNLALKPVENVITFPRRVEPALFTELKKSKKAKPKGKQPTFKEATGSLSNQLFPEVLPDETGRFAIESQGAGFVVRFRDDVPLVEGSIKKSHYFFRVSRKLYNTWKGLSKDEQRTQIAKHVRGHLRDAIERGNAEARSIARKLRV